MNIGIVCYPTFGGSGVVATELGNALANKGCKVHFISYSQPVRLNILERNIYYHEVNVQDYPLFQYQPYELALSSKMVDTVINENIDVLHVHYAIPHAYAAFMAKQILKDEGISIPVITTLHGTDITLVGRNPSYRRAVKFSINKSDYVTAVSHNLKKQTQTFFDCGTDIEVIPNFIDNELYKQYGDCDKTALADEGEKLITHISNFRKVKRTEDVIEVFAGIHEKIQSKLILVGDGPERGKVLERAKELGLGRDVIYLGKTTEVERILCLTDLFLLPSESESFGLAALEAMAGGSPVISSNAGGLPEVNIDGVTGYTCNVGDIDDMIKKSIYILNNKTIHDRFKHKARLRAESFDIKVILPQYIKLYEKAVQNE